MINNNPASFPYLSTLIEKRQLFVCTGQNLFQPFEIWEVRTWKIKLICLSSINKMQLFSFLLSRVDIHTKFCKKFKKCAIFGGHIAQFAIVNQRFLMNFFWLNEVQFVQKCFNFLNFFRVLCNLGSNHKINL